MFSALSDTQKCLFNEFKFDNYIKNIAWSPEQKREWTTGGDGVIKTPALTRAKIVEIERATRGQNANHLWSLLRLDRKTASLSGNNTTNIDIHCTPALVFGNKQESEVKTTNTIVFDRMREHLNRENMPRASVINTVLDCGMFFSHLGLHSASPDAFFELSDGTWIPVEIKCPYTYRDTTVDQMRASLGKKKMRYRIKHTALSVNRFGAPEYRVEKTDPHYRQMQRQMYVMNAPMCFYLVKFKNSLVVNSVRRDEQFYAKELANESHTYAMAAQENSFKAAYRRLDKRVQSFRTHSHNHAYTASEVERLVKRGIYLSYGYLKCAFCDTFTMSSRELIDSVLLECHVNCDKDIVDFVNGDYFDYDKRLQSLLNTLKCHCKKETAETLAYHGWYCDNNDSGGNDGSVVIKTFCCGSFYYINTITTTTTTTTTTIPTISIINSDNIMLPKHIEKCKYYLKLTK
jgi:hypothetical protein